MRLDGITEEDARLVRVILRANADLEPNPEDRDRLRKLADRFNPPERVTAEVRDNVYTHGLYRVSFADGRVLDTPMFVAQFTSEAEAEEVRAAHYSPDTLAVRPLPEAYEATELTCPACGGTMFSYEEGCSQYWPGDEDGADVDAKVVHLNSIGWDGIGESGDGEPGLFCDSYRGGGCGRGIDLPEGWDYDFD